MNCRVVDGVVRFTVPTIYGNRRQERGVVSSFDADTYCICYTGLRVRGCPWFAHSAPHPNANQCLSCAPGWSPGGQAQEQGCRFLRPISLRDFGRFVSVDPYRQSMSGEDRLEVVE